MKHDGQNLRASDYRIEKVAHKIASEFIVNHHYAKSTSLMSVFAFGLYENKSSRLVGGALFMPPTKLAAQTVSKDNWKAVLTLSRLAIHPDVPRNGASFFLSRCVKHIQKQGDYSYLLTYADTMQGHTGGIYRACGWTYVGLTQPTEVWVHADGRRLGRKRGKRNLSHQEMRETGFTLIGYFSKHKFVKKLKEDKHYGT